MKLPLQTAPGSICILRMSAIGDVSHTLPVVRTLQTKWPETRITWIVGKTEYGLLSGIDDIEFIVFDKSNGLKEYWNLYRQLRVRRFDVLCHMQMSIRSSVASLFIRSGIRLGFDRKRAKDFQWLFTNQKIDYKPRQHVMESFFGFAEKLGISHRVMEWKIPVDESDIAEARKLIPAAPYFIISPCSSVSYRNWSIEGYTAVARYVYDKYGLKCVLCGGFTDIEQRYSDEIQARLFKDGLDDAVVNLIGKTNLKQLLVVLGKSKFLISPDAGPAHLGTAMKIPVIGLYACTNPDRARPYLSKEYVVNRYPEAVLKEYGKEAEKLPWGIRVRKPEAMSLITESDVCTMVDRVLNEN